MIIRQFFLSLFVVLSLTAQTEWGVLHLSPEQLRRPHFINANIGWALDEFTGECYITKDGGKSWKTSDLSGYSRDIFFIDANRGWSCGNANYISRSSDGGETWEVLTEEDWSFNYAKIYFANENTGWIITDNAQIKKTTDGGDTWTELNTDDGISLYPESVYFLNESIGWITGYNNSNAALIMTTDGGSSWVDTTFQDYQSINNVKFENETEGILLTMNGSIGTTDDGGRTWLFDKNESASTSEIFIDLAYYDEEVQIATGYTSTATFGTYPFIVVNDGAGINWQKFNIDSESILELGYFNDSEGLLLGGKNVFEFTFDSSENTISINELTDNAKNQFRDIFFITEEEGFAVTFSEMFKTTNGGYNWDKVDSLENRSSTIYFPSEDNGWYIGSFVYKTRDGGNTWEEIDFGNTNDWMDITFVNENLGWLLGYNLLYKTSNGGESWNEIEGMEGEFTSISFVDEYTGYICESDSIIWKTTNGGTTWNSIDVPDFYSMEKIEFQNESTGWLTANKFYKTENGGANWEVVSDNQFDLSDSFILNESIWLIGSDVNGGWLQYSDNNGESWAEFSLTNRELNSIFMLNEETGWIAGQAGLVMGTSNIVNVNDNFSGEITNKFQLSQNYPNPFNPSTQIEYNVPYAGEVVIKVYDILGREVATLVNGFVNAGKHTATFNSNEHGSLSSGIYLIRMISQDFTEVRKIMLLK